MIDYTGLEIIAVDFDGTLCEDRWPDIGMPNLDLIKYVTDKRDNGAKVILWTCRTGSLLKKAVAWCGDHGLYFDAVNENIPEIAEIYGSEASNKVTATTYIDDKNDYGWLLPYVHRTGIIGRFYQFIMGGNWHEQN